MVGELYEACLREELRTTEGDAVEAADIGFVKGIVFRGCRVVNVPVA